MTKERQRVSVREDNRRRTHERIIDATAQLTRETGHSGFSMPEVAEHAGVSLRTLYRYFSTRQDLINELATVADQVDVGPLPTGLADVEPWLATAWANLMQEEALLRAQHTGPDGTSIRKARIPRHRAITASLVDSVRPDLDTQTRDDIINIALLASSSTALFEFVDILEMSSADAARLATTIITAVLSDAPSL